MSNTLLRQWAMLRLVPRYPRKTDTRTLTEALKGEGFVTTQRTVQRDLKTLSGLFPELQNDGNRDVAGWFWHQDTPIQDIPGMDPPMALTFKLVETFLQEQIPPGVMGFIRPYLDCADRVLEQVDQPGLRQWVDKVRILPRTQALLPAAIEREHMQAIYQALLESRALRGRYRSRSGGETEFEFHPLGLVFRHCVVYLVATVWDYQDPRHYALHRFTHCELTDRPSKIPDDFNLDHYLATGSFDYPEDTGATLQVRLRFPPETAAHLGETPLSGNQTIAVAEDGRMEVTAMVRDTRQLRWWLLGFGHRVEVMAPEPLRREFARIARAMAAAYDRDGERNGGGDTLASRPVAMGVSGPV